MSSNCRVAKKYVLALTAVLLVFATLGWAGDEKDDSKADSDIVKRMDKAADVLKEIEGAPDNGIPDNIMGDAKCIRSEEHTSELQSLTNLVCRLLLEKK